MFSHKDWIEWAIHNIPFAALMTVRPPPNRPMATRIAEQATVGILAAAFSGAGVLYVDNVRNQDNIANMTQTLAKMQSELNTMHDMAIVEAVSKNDITDLKRRVDRIEFKEK